METTQRESILMVDDEKPLRDAMVVYLSQEGYEVHPCSSGEEALDLLKRIPVDILIADMKLPGIDGNAVLRKLSFSTHKSLASSSQVTVLWKAPSRR
jgi:DNA-binding response OmpR family regulator